MKPPLLHPRTNNALESYLQKPAHGLILSGPAGAGKTTVARWIASQQNCKLIIIEALEKTTGVSIEQIRELYHLTRTGSSLIIVVRDAQTMSSEAQNAFLKLLEEPPQNTRFILTTPHKESLLATIQSRSQQIEVYPPKTRLILERAEKQFDMPILELQRLLISVNKLPGTFFNLLKDSDKLSAYTTATEQAKNFYVGSPYQRHLMCIEQKFDRAWAIQLLDLLATIIQALLQTQKEALQLKKLLSQAELIEDVASSLKLTNASVKIQLTKLSETL